MGAIIYVTVSNDRLSDAARWGRLRPPSRGGRRMDQREADRVTPVRERGFDGGLFESVPCLKGAGLMEQGPEAPVGASMAEYLPGFLP